MKQVSITPLLGPNSSQFSKQFLDRSTLLVPTLVLLLGALVFLAHSASAEQGREIPKDLHYDVWIDAKPLGTHAYRFSRDAAGDLLQVDSNAVFNVKVLFVNVFSYNHSATELWNGQCLSSISSNTTTNGEKEAIELRFDDANCPGTYTYWDRSRLERSILTNAQTGEQEDASLQKLASTPLPRPSKKVKLSREVQTIEHYQLTTPSADFLLWYDDQGRNLMMQTTNDGRTITYINRELR